MIPPGRIAKRMETRATAARAPSPKDPSGKRALRSTVPKDIYNESLNNFEKMDHSALRLPINIGSLNIQQIVASITEGPPELKDLVLNECEIIYECRVCRNLYRSLPLFIAHKRVYCTKHFCEQMVHCSSKRLFSEDDDDEDEFEGDGQFDGPPTSRRTLAKHLVKQKVVYDLLAQADDEVDILRNGSELNNCDISSKSSAKASSTKCRQLTCSSNTPDVQPMFGSTLKRNLRSTSGNDAKKMKNLENVVSKLNLKNNGNSPCNTESLQTADGYQSDINYEQDFEKEEDGDSKSGLEHKKNDINGIEPKFVIDKNTSRLAGPPDNPFYIENLEQIEAAYMQEILEKLHLDDRKETFNFICPFCPATSTYYSNSIRHLVKKHLLTRPEAKVMLFYKFSYKPPSKNAEETNPLCSVAHLSDEEETNWEEVKITSDLETDLNDDKPDELDEIQSEVKTSPSDMEGIIRSVTPQVEVPRSELEQHNSELDMFHVAESSNLTYSLQKSPCAATKRSSKRARKRRCWYNTHDCSDTSCPTHAKSSYNDSSSMCQPELLSSGDGYENGTAESLVTSSEPPALIPPPIEYIFDITPEISNRIEQFADIETLSCKSCPSEEFISQELLQHHVAYLHLNFRVYSCKQCASGFRPAYSTLNRPCMDIHLKLNHPHLLRNKMLSETDFTENVNIDYPLPQVVQKSNRNSVHKTNANQSGISFTRHNSFSLGSSSSSATSTWDPTTSHSKRAPDNGDDHDFAPPSTSSSKLVTKLFVKNLDNVSCIAPTNSDRTTNQEQPSNYSPSLKLHLRPIASGSTSYQIV